MQKLYSTGEAAELLGVGTSRVKQLVADGRLVPCRADPPRMFTLEAIRALMAGGWPLPPGGPGKPRGPRMPIPPLVAIGPATADAATVGGV